jgi:hypothetical protein
MQNLPNLVGLAIRILFTNLIAEMRNNIMGIRRF